MARKRCQECRTPFTPRASGSPQVYCGAKCKDRHDGRLRRQRHPDRVRRWFDEHPGYLRQKNRRLRLRVLYVLGGMECACCGETIIDFLTIEHIRGGGNQHRRAVGMNYYQWIIDNKYPDDLQVLCIQCNWGRRYTGICPHEIQEVHRGVA